MQIECRTRTERNNDPQRRCYYGCHYSTELGWTPWEVLVPDVSEDTVKEKLKFWRDINAYAVSARGESARREFRVTSCM